MARVLAVHCPAARRTNGTGGGSASRRQFTPRWGIAFLLRRAPLLETGHMRGLAYFPVTLAMLWYLRHQVFPVSSRTDNMP